MSGFVFRVVATLVGLGCTSGVAQEARLRNVSELAFPTLTDGNSPAFWLNGRLHLFTSIGMPLEISASDSQFHEWESEEVDVTDLLGKPVWVESAWVDDDGTVFGWYHHEELGLYEDSLLTAPKIGAVVSFDGGRTIYDLGFVLVSGDPLDDDAQNGSFTGGHGDFSVVLDPEGRYFYFFFTNYGGEDESQGVAVARLAFKDRFQPAGRVYKYYQGEWREPGLGGSVTPIFPPVRAWWSKNPDSFWGPSVHWNTFLNCFVMLLNRTNGVRGWNQEGIYVTYSSDLSRPEMWKTPTKLLDSVDFPSWGHWYPQVMGFEFGGTDSLAGQTARFYLSGASQWEISFYLDDDRLHRKPSNH